MQRLEPWAGRPRPEAGIAFVGALTLVGFAVYWSTLSSFFVGDDFETLLKVTDRDPTGTLDHVGGTLRPVTWLSFAVNWAVSGPSPLAYHVVSVAVHVMNAWLVALLARRLLTEFADRPAPIDRLLPSLCGVVFLVAPSHTEAVSWIAARADLVMTAACLAGLVNWIGAAEGSRRRCLTTACFATAMLTKESAIAFPLVLGAFEMCRRGGVERGRRRIIAAITRPWPEYLVVVGFLGLRRVLRGNFVGDQGQSVLSMNPVRLVAKTIVAVARSLLPGMDWRGWVICGVVAAAVTGAGSVSSAAQPLDRRVWWFLGSAVVACTAPIANLGVRPFDVGGERLVYLTSVFSVIAAMLFVRPLTAASGRASWASLGVVFVASVVALTAANSNWVSAGRSSRQVIAGVAAWPTDERVVLLNSPDSVGGAVVSRNSLAAASVLLHGWTRPALISEVSSVRLAGPSDRVQVVRRDCPTCLRLRLLDPSSAFEEVATAGSSWELPDIAVSIVDERTIEARFERITLDRVWYFDGGRVGAVPLR